MAQSNRTAVTRKGSRPERPEKPYADYPLFPHAAGSWAKKINGKLYYFGGWANDPNGEEALAKYKWQREGLERGIPQSELTEPMSLDEMEEKQKHDPEHLTLYWLRNAFLTAMESKVEAGKLSTRSFTDYQNSSRRMRDAIGSSKRVKDLTVGDFNKLAKELWKMEPKKGQKQRRVSPRTFGNLVRRISRVFNWAHTAGVINNMPRFGDEFKQPSYDDIEEYQEEQDIKHEKVYGTSGDMIEREDLLLLLEKADVELRAMILLAANCGYGNMDVSNLTKSMLDMEEGWLELRLRKKSKKPRKAKLWRETCEALREALAIRPPAEFAEYDDRVFLTPSGKPLVRTGPSGKSNINDVSKRFDALLKELDMKRPGLSFYSLRGSYETTATACGDQIAVDISMGHSVKGIKKHYIKRGAKQWNERLARVANHVHDWLWPEGC